MPWQKNYPRCNKLFFRRSDAAPLLTGCVVHDKPRYRSESRPPAVQIVVGDDCDYYPSYGIYHSRNRHEYVYRDGKPVGADFRAPGRHGTNALYQPASENGFSRLSGKSSRQRGAQLPEKLGKAG